MPPAINSVNAFSNDIREHLLLINEPDPDHSEPKLKLRGLTRVSDTGVEILKGIDLDIPKGMVVGVIGPSGSGKSTMLRSLNRLWEPNSGSVFLDGVDICDVEVVRLRRKVGMLFQLPALFEGQFFN